METMCCKNICNVIRILVLSLTNPARHWCKSIVFSQEIDSIAWRMIQIMLGLKTVHRSVTKEDF